MFLSELYYPHGSGAELATHLYANLLSSTGVKVTVVTNKFKGELDTSISNNLTIYRLPLFNDQKSVKFSTFKRFDILLSSFLRKLITDADVIYVPRLWYSVLPLANKLKKPTIVHLHDYIPTCSLSTLYESSKNIICPQNRRICSAKCIYSFERVQGRQVFQSLASTVLNLSLNNFISNLINYSTIVLCVSDIQRQLINQRLPFLCHKTKVIHNPLPTFYETKMTGEDFGYFGGPSYMKGFNSLCLALSNIDQSHHPNIRIHGTKFPNKRMPEYLNKLGFVTYRKLSSAEYERMYSNIKCVIVPSVWHEPWPYVIVEGLIKGRFILASRMGGIPDQLKGCKGVLTFEAGDYHSLARGIEYVQGLSKEEVMNMGLQNKDAYLKRYNNDSTLTKFIKTCEQLI